MITKGGEVRLPVDHRTHKDQINPGDEIQAI